MRGKVLIGALLGLLILLGALGTAHTQPPSPPDAGPIDVPLQSSLVWVIVPERNAAVWIGDKQMQQLGNNRMFVTPPLPVGSTYSYEIRAAWEVDGKQVTRKRTVEFRPGQEVRVTFLEGDEAVPAPAVKEPRVKEPVGRPAERPFDVLPGRLTREELQELAPGLGYLKAHKNVKNPFDLLGGPVRVKLAAVTDDARIILPGKRALDMHVFGIPGLPRAWGGTPGINGVPLDWRKVGPRGDRYTEVSKETAASNNWLPAKGAVLALEALDVTATDAAVSKDRVKFAASWKDADGNVYTVKCDNAVPHGTEYPVFGGVVTNHLMHGFTRVGSALMPTEFVYVAFWGTGETLKNGKVTQKPVLVHGMLSEKVRVRDYQLAHDEQVIPTERHFHVMVPPFLPKKGKMEYEHRPVNTGFKMKDGKELPFWHVMFEDVRIETVREPAAVVVPVVPVEKKKQKKD